MPYQINKFNGERLVVLEDGTVDATTCINLVGKNFAGYGEVQNENFLWLLENFADSVSPGKALTGQLWYDSANKKIKVYTGSSWNIVGGTKVSNIEPTDATAGDSWLDTNTNKLYVHNGTEFLFVGPETATGFGVTRFVSEIIEDTLGNEVPVIKGTVNDTVILVVTDRACTISSSTPILGFTTLSQGVNLSSTSPITGNLIGNASTADALSTPRAINGVDFDGTSDITITASLTTSLSPGDYINGNSFDGSTDLTWSVNATNSDAGNTIVARDVAGNFSANTITADLIGDTTGTHTGQVNGPVVGDVIGDVTGNLTGDVIGDVTGNLTGDVTGSVIGNVKGSLLAADNSVAYDGTTKTFTGELDGNALTASSLETPVTINGVSFNGLNSITIADFTKLPTAGGVMTGPIVLAADPTADLQAATKQYVDGKDSDNYDAIMAALPPNYTITYGNTQYSTSGYTNSVGNWYNSANYFDVYPPGIKTMADLVAFLPSIAVIHYAGGVDGNDSLRCTWSNLGDRIRVWVQNTEQRSLPAANWIAIWR